MNIRFYDSYSNYYKGNLAKLSGGQIVESIRHDNVSNAPEKDLERIKNNEKPIFWRPL